MKIRMTETRTGCPDGINEVTHEEGETYDCGTNQMSERLARIYLAAGWAEPVEGFESFDGDGSSPEPSDGGQSESEGEPDQSPTREEESEPSAQEQDQAEGESEPEPDGDYTKEQVGSSPYYRFLGPDGEVLTDEDEDEIRVLGKDAADQKLEEMNQS